MYSGKKTINGYYAKIDGFRDQDEVWRILYWHIDRFVKERKIISENHSEEYLHVVFDINKSGNVQHMSIVDGSKKMHLSE